MTPGFASRKPEGGAASEAEAADAAEPRAAGPPGPGEVSTWVASQPARQTGASVPAATTSVERRAYQGRSGSVAEADSGGGGLSS